MNNTKSTRLILCLTSCALMVVSFQTVQAQTPKTPADLRQLAAEYYNWRNQNFPVFSSDAGLHTWDNRLTDYSLSAVLARRLHAKEAARKSAGNAHGKIGAKTIASIGCSSAPSSKASFSSIA